MATNQAWSAGQMRLGLLRERVWLGIASAAPTDRQRDKAQETREVPVGEADRDPDITSSGNAGRVGAACRCPGRPPEHSPAVEAAGRRTSFSPRVEEDTASILRKVPTSHGGEVMNRRGHGRVGGRC